MISNNTLKFGLGSLAVSVDDFYGLITISQVKALPWKIGENLAYYEYKTEYTNGQWVTLAVTQQEVCKLLSLLESVLNGDNQFEFKDYVFDFSADTEKESVKTCIRLVEKLRNQGKYPARC